MTDLTVPTIAPHQSYLFKYAYEQAKAERARLAIQRDRSQAELFVAAVRANTSKELFVWLWGRTKLMFPDDPSWDNKK